jgi:hypothetical protein
LGLGAITAQVEKLHTAVRISSVAILFIYILELYRRNSKLDEIAHPEILHFHPDSVQAPTAFEIEQ